jgi:hypothetical protein
VRSPSVSPTGLLTGDHLERNRLDLAGPKGDHPPEDTISAQFRGVSPEPRGDQPIGRRRSTSPLQMTQHRDANVVVDVFRSEFMDRGAGPRPSMDVESRGGCAVADD